MMQQEYSKEFKEQPPVSFQHTVGHSWKNLGCEPHRLFPACLQDEKCVPSVRKEKKLKTWTSSGQSLTFRFSARRSSSQHCGHVRDQVLCVHNVNKLSISSYRKTTSTTTVSESLLAFPVQNLLRETKALVRRRSYSSTRWNWKTCWLGRCPGFSIPGAPACCCFRSQLIMLSRWWSQPYD